VHKLLVLRHRYQSSICSVKTQIFIFLRWKPMERRKKFNCFFWICIHGWLNFSSKIEKNKGDRDFKMEYINIRGYDCYNCTAWISQTSNWHLHTDSYHGIHRQFTSARNGAVASSGGEDNFGYYYAINPLHRCTSGDNATTQWWFGEQ